MMRMGEMSLQIRGAIYAFRGFVLLGAGSLDAADERPGLSVFDILGREVSVLVNERRDAGVHEATINASALARGVYLYRLTAGSFVETRKFVLVRRIHTPQGKQRAWQSSPGSTIYID